LAPRDLHTGLRDHRVALDRTSTASTGELDRRLGERAADAAVPGRGSCGEAGDNPHSVVGGVLAALLAQAPLLRDEWEGGARFDTAPASGLAADVRQQDRGDIPLWVPALRLPTHNPAPLVVGRPPPARDAELEALAETQPVPA